MMMIKAGQIKAGQLMYQRSGVYRVDGNTVHRGLAHIGTCHGVCVVPAEKMMAVSNND